MKRWLRTLLLCISWSSAAAAQTPAQLERAKTAFRAGANAYAAGDYLAAIQALELAYQLTPLPALAFSLAQAERKQFFVDDDRRHLERATELFQRYLEQAPRGPRREDARLALLQLRPLLGPAGPATGEAALPPSRPTRVMIVADAPGARIALDGGPPAASPLIREVTPGRHLAFVQAPGFHRAERELTAVAGELILTEVRLLERPSPLYVRAPVGADIFVDGVFAGHAGERTLVVVLPTGRHEVAVARKGYELERRRVDIERGKASSIAVALEPTFQRGLSEVLFIGGGAALGASLVLSALTVRSENRAEAFLGRREQGNVNSAQLVSYQASVSDRNRYRGGTAVTLASSAGLFITGLFLHELDQPSLQPSRPSVRASGRFVAPSSPHVSSVFSIVPRVDTQQASAALQLDF